MAFSIAGLREAFKQQYSIFISSGEFDSADVDRLLSDDELCECFIISSSTTSTSSSADDSKQSASHLQACLLQIEAAFKWRRRDQINQLAANSAAVMDGQAARSARFLDGYDRCRYSVLLIHSSDYPRSLKPEQLTAARQHIAWLLDSRHRVSPASPVTLLLDMSDCSVGLSASGVNFELLKFVVHACSSYYPNYLARLLVYEMPWVLTAAWKFLRTWLDRPAQAKVGFVWRSTICDYIDSQHLPERMGGPQNRPNAEKIDQKSPKQATSTSRKFRLRKSVSFSHAGHHSGAATTSRIGNNNYEFLNTAGATINRSPRKRGGILKIPKPTNDVSADSMNQSVAVNQADAAVELAAENSFVGRYFTVSPADRLDFAVSSSTTNSSCYCSVRIINTSSGRWIAFKVRTTAPNDYRVKPSCSILPPNSCVSIVVLRRTANNSMVSRPAVRQQLPDRLQIIAAPLELPVHDNRISDRDIAQNCLKSTRPDQLMEHRLLCRLVPVAVDSESDGLGTDGQDVSGASIEQLAAEVAGLRQTVNRLSSGKSVQVPDKAESTIDYYRRCWIIYLVLLLLAFSLGWFISSSSSATTGNSSITDYFKFDQIFIIFAGLL
ncbi:hypothetical protein BOX15_Mlig015289g1 [Macrostomum lignano]|uniref:Motile sperm domain-containing protein 2 n=1 Tax=Macrostomum lignano TaxID=282301 RepID=A0A267F0M6_9PLAT|nr:hypothetical protein BOX15_Mlig015289g1 [Macrostomum lignano]